MSDLPRVRQATAADDQVVRLLLLAMYNEVPPLGPLDENGVGGMIAECHANGTVLLSLSAAGEPVATMGLAASKVPWAHAHLLNERWLFVHPGHRQRPHATGLLRVAKDVSRGCGLPLHAGVFSTRRTAGKIRLYERELGQMVGAGFLWMPGEARHAAL